MFDVLFFLKRRKEWHIFEKEGDRKNGRDDLESRIRPSWETMLALFCEVSFFRDGALSPYLHSALQEIRFSLVIEYLMI